MRVLLVIIIEIRVPTSPRHEGGWGKGLIEGQRGEPLEIFRQETCHTSFGQSQITWTLCVMLCEPTPAEWKLRQGKQKRIAVARVADVVQTASRGISVDEGQQRIA